MSDKNTDWDTGKSYGLLDAQAQNRDHPNTFHIPNDQDVSEIEPGGHIKACFTDRENGSERMWIIVTEVGPNREWFDGTLDNDPICIDAEVGDEVHILRKHLTAALTKAEMKEFCANT